MHFGLTLPSLAERFAERTETSGFVAAGLCIYWWMRRCTLTDATMRWVFDLSILLRPSLRGMGHCNHSANLKKVICTENSKIWIVISVVPCSWSRAKLWARNTWCKGPQDTKPLLARIQRQSVPWRSKHNQAWPQITEVVATRDTNPIKVNLLYAIVDLRRLIIAYWSA